MTIRLHPVQLIGAVGLLAACSGGSPTAAPASGALTVQLTDAPFPFDSVQRVDVFVVRVDAKTAATDSAEASRNTADSDRDGSGWTTVAEPKAKFELLALRNGLTALLGQKALPAGDYQGFRLIIDPAQSSVTLKGGQAVDVQWPGASRSGIKIQLDRNVTVGATPATLVVDFDVSQAFVMRGSAMKNGLLFKPVLHATPK